MVTSKNQERFRTDKGVFDDFTNRTLFKLQSEGHFDELVSPLMVGKESNVFIAQKDETQVIIKIYRMQNCDFLRMYEYIRQDKRYEFLKNHRRFIILAWAQREFKNLYIAKKAGILTPKPIAWKNHIIIEEMIGEPALPLKDQYPQNPEHFYKLVIKQIGMLHKQGLVHGDLSAFNILNYNEKPYFIDYSQSTLKRAYNFNELLKRDLKNICQFFKKLNVSCNVEETFKKLTEGDE